MSIKCQLWPVQTQESAYLMYSNDSEMFPKITDLTLNCVFNIF